MDNVVIHINPSWIVAGAAALTFFFGLGLRLHLVLSKLVIALKQLEDHHDILKDHEKRIGHLEGATGVNPSEE